MTMKKAMSKVKSGGSKKQEKPVEPNPAMNRAAMKKERFMAARRNNDVLIIRISSEILQHLAELGWQRGSQSGAATIAREVLELWYQAECQRANKK